MSRTQPVNPDVSLHEQLQCADFAHWLDLHKRINDFTTARLIVEFLDQYPSQKARHMGVYLRARESVQRYRIRCAKRYRAALLIGKMVGKIGRLCQMIGKVTAWQLAKPKPAGPATPALVWPGLCDPTQQQQTR